MSPAQFNDIHQHARKELSPSPSISSSFPLKINKDSHFIKKSSSSLTSSPSSSSSSSTSSLLVNGVVTNVTNKSNQQQQQRHPVIIYTHSPKIIHTHPKDFMALVQKLTGLSRTDEDDSDGKNIYNNDTPRSSNIDDDRKKLEKGAAMGMYEDNESTSVVTEDNNSGSGGGSSGSTFGEVQINSCFVARPIFDPPAVAPNPCFNSIPFFNPSSTDFLCTTSHHHANQPPFYNYSEDSSLFYMPNIRSSLSSSTLEGMKELPDF